jgi:hypothetical protein
MLTATGMFMDSLEKWLRAVRADDFTAARQHAENLVRAGDLLVIHPDFRHCFGRHYPDVEPKDAMLHLCQTLVCATDGRARVLRQWVHENRPIDTLDEPDRP